MNMNKIIMTLAFMLTSIASHAQLSTEAQAVIKNIMTLIPLDNAIFIFKHNKNY